MNFTKVLSIIGLLCSGLLAAEDTGKNEASSAAACVFASNPQGERLPDERAQAPSPLVVAGRPSVTSANLSELIQGKGTDDLFHTICEFLGVYPAYVLTATNKQLRLRMVGDSTLWSTLWQTRPEEQRPAILMLTEGNYYELRSYSFVKQRAIATRICLLSQFPFEQKLPDYVRLCIDAQLDIPLTLPMVPEEGRCEIAAAYFEATNDTELLKNTFTTALARFGLLNIMYNKEAFYNDSRTLRSLWTFITKYDLASCKEPLSKSLKLLDLTLFFLTTEYEANADFGERSYLKQKLMEKVENIITTLGLPQLTYEHYTLLEAIYRHAAHSSANPKTTYFVFTRALDESLSYEERSNDDIIVRFIEKPKDFPHPPLFPAEMSLRRFPVFEGECDFEIAETKDEEAATQWGKKAIDCSSKKLKLFDAKTPGHSIHFGSSSSSFSSSSLSSFSSGAAAPR